MRELAPGHLDQRLAELAQQSAQLRDWLDQQPRVYTVGDVPGMEVGETATATALAPAERLRMEQEAAALTLRMRSDALLLRRVQARLRDGVGEEVGPGMSLDVICWHVRRHLMIA
jgi:hypothetical protein